MVRQYFSLYEYISNQILLFKTHRLPFNLKYHCSYSKFRKNIGYTLTFIEINHDINIRFYEFVIFGVEKKKNKYDW